MQCEICGRETAKLMRIILDGSHLAVCSGCSSFGTREPPKPAFESPVARNPGRVFELPGLVQGYGRLVRQAREQQGLTIEELGKKVFEKASFLHRIEAESAKPGSGLARKLESTLGVRILEGRE